MMTQDRVWCAARWSLRAGAFHPQDALRLGYGIADHFGLNAIEPQGARPLIFEGVVEDDVRPKRCVVTLRRGGGRCAVDDVLFLTVG